MASSNEVHGPQETLAQDPLPSEADNAPASEDRPGAQNPDCNGVSSSGAEEEGLEETLARADELFEKGTKAIEDGDFVDAVDCLSRALEIRVSHFGELAQECAISYYKYGCALLYKAQEEADPLGNFPQVPQKNAEKARSFNCMEDGGSSKASVDDSNDTSSFRNEEIEGEGFGDKDYINDEVDSQSEDEDTAEADEDESDLDLAWKMLDIAREIVKMRPGYTLEKVNILAALAEVSMEREDIEASLNDYLKALSILEHLVEPDNRRIVELNFRISLVLELGSRIEEAIPYCEKAISLCKSHLQRLKEDATNLTTPTGASGSSVSGLEKRSNPSAEDARSGSSNLVEEIELLSGILTDLEKKLEDLQQIKANPRSVVSEVMKLIAPKQTTDETNARSGPRTLSLNSSQMGAINGGFDSPTISTAATNVVDLSTVGRGIKKATLKPSSAEPSQEKQMLDMPTRPRTLSWNSSWMGALNGGFDSPTISTAATNVGVVDLGTVGRGIKRATLKPSSGEPSPKKTNVGYAYRES